MEEESCFQFTCAIVPDIGLPCIIGGDVMQRMNYVEYRNDKIITVAVPPEKARGMIT